jgi:hypothetical protein
MALTVSRNLRPEYFKPVVLDIRPWANGALFCGAFLKKHLFEPLQRKLRSAVFGRSGDFIGFPFSTIGVISLGPGGKSRLRVRDGFR